MKKKNFFWIGYSDLMTSMFFIMLVLYIVSHFLWQKEQEDNIKMIAQLEQLKDSLQNQAEILKKQKEKLVVAARQYERIKEIDQTVLDLSNSEYFLYNSECKRFELNMDDKEIFESNKWLIKNQFKNYLEEAGKYLSKFIDQTADGVYMKYIVIIEGRSARFDDSKLTKKYGSITKDISFNRAKALYDLWTGNGVHFDQNKCEIQISGSGFDGECRYTGSQETLNKRFIVHVIPNFAIMD